MKHAKRPLVCEYLLSHSRRQLFLEHGVCSRSSSDFTKLSLNYDMFAIKNGDLLAEQCRGLVVRPLDWYDVIDEDDTLDEVVGPVDVVAWPMDRFYNHGQPGAADVDWNDPNLHVYEKLDGTMCTLYFDFLKNEWCVATRAVSEADVEMYTKGIASISKKSTYAELFWTAFTKTLEAMYRLGNIGSDGRHHALERFDRNTTYVFELTGPENRVVVKYDEPKLTLIAMRDNTTGEEVDISDDAKVRARSMYPWQTRTWPRPQTWKLNNAPALLAFVSTASPDKLEGAVVCDSKFRRVKVKNKAYVIAWHAIDTVTLSKRSVIEAIVNESIDDVIPLVSSNLAEEIIGIRDAYKKLCNNIDTRFVGFKAQAGDCRKDFALLVNASGDWQLPYFHMFSKKAVSTHDMVKTMQENGKLTSSLLDTIISNLDA